MAADFRYKAFLSYSHLDRRWGIWLHKALESYRVPKRLVGTSSVRGTIPAKLFPIFRDQEELASSSDLSAEIEKALAQSEFLIVICSPNAARSDWVNQEVLRFKRMGREDRIRTLIIDGDPNAREAVPPDEAQSCFPPSLMFRIGADGMLTDERHEAGAADVRPGRDSRNIALLRLVAPLLGVGFDELRQREAEAARRRSLVTRSIAGAFALLLVTAALVGWIALRRTKEAAQKAEEANLERQKKQVETLRIISDDAIRTAGLGYGTEALRKMLGGLDSNAEAARSSLPPVVLASLTQAIRAPQFSYVLSDPSLVFLGARYSRNERFVVTRSTRSDEGGFAVIHDGRTGRKLQELQGDMVGISDTIIWPSSSGSGVVVFFRPFGRDSVAAFSPFGEPATTTLTPLPFQRVLDDGDDRAILAMRDGRHVLLTKTGGAAVAPIRLAAGQRVIAANADDRRLIVADGRTMRVINALTGNPIAGPWPSDGEVVCAALSREGDHAAAVFKAGGNYRGLIFSLAGTGPPRELALMPNREFERVMADPIGGLATDIAFGDDGKSVVVLWNFGEVWRWNLDGQFVGRVRSPLGSSGSSASLSPRGSWVLQYDHAWSTRSGVPDQALRMPPVSQPVAGRAGCPPPDGSQTEFTICPAQTSHILRISRYEELILPGQGAFRVFRRNGPGEWTRIVVTPDGRFVPALRNCNDRNRCQLVLLDLVRGEVVAHRDDVHELDRAAVTDDGHFVAAFDDARGFIWDTRADRVSPAFTHDASIASGIRTIVTDALFIGTERLVTSGTDGTIRIWSSPGAFELTRDSGREYAGWLLLTADGGYVIAGYGIYDSEHPGLRPIDIFPARGSLADMARGAVQREEQSPGRCTGLPLRDVRERAFQEADLDTAIDRLGIDELDRDLLYYHVCMDQLDRVAKAYPALPRDGLKRLRDTLQNRPR